MQHSAWVTARQAVRKSARPQTAGKEEDGRRVARVCLNCGFKSYPKELSDLQAVLNAARAKGEAEAKQRKEAEAECKRATVSLRPPKADEKTLQELLASVTH